MAGGAEFIGGNFVQYIVEKYPEYDVYNLDSLTYAGDLTKHRMIENIDFIIHFAAESHVDRSILDPGIFVKTNVLGTQILLEAAKKIELTKFVHVSTDEVYGELNFDTTTFFTEETPLQANSPYSASKASSDLLVRAYHKTYGIPINIMRCSNNYGPFHFPKKLIPLTIIRALNNEKVPVYGNGGNVRDWLHVFDHCVAIDLVLHKGVNGEIYNIGGHNERANLEVVKTILQILDKTERLIEFVEDRLGHDKRYAIDVKKIEQLGWNPSYTFEKGIIQTIQWYVEKEDWWRQIVSGQYQAYFNKQYTLGTI